MPKPVNIQSLLQAKKSLNHTAFESYVLHLGIKIRDAEIEDLQVLADTLADAGCGINGFDAYHIGYQIPQIGKEFDLLRFGKNSILNIELKNESSEEKIKKQLLRNKYYLSFIGRTVHNFTFVSDTKTLHRLNKNELLETAPIEKLSKLIIDQEPEDTSDIDQLFNPSDYLISPFNRPVKFLAGKYFLTHQQEEEKAKVAQTLAKRGVAQFFSITGAAGTGKTLLTYDIARQLIQDDKRVLIIHCGSLNRGHHTLKKHDWEIIAIKDYASQDLSKFDLIIIDEAQRIRTKQLNTIVEAVKSNKKKCIFSYDSAQTLSNQETSNNIDSEIKSIESIISCKLSEKIRTNKQIASFIKQLFDKSKPIVKISKNDVTITYFDNNNDAKKYFNGLDQDVWEVLRFTPSQYDNEHHEKYHETWSKNSHEVIGQEFDNVAIAIDKFFKYDSKGLLTYSASVYYDLVKMLFQNITRTRKKLNLVIIDNEELLTRCLAIVQ